MFAEISIQVIDCIFSFLSKFCEINVSHVGKIMIEMYIKFQSIDLD